LPDLLLRYADLTRATLERICGLWDFSHVIFKEDSASFKVRSRVGEIEEVWSTCDDETKDQMGEGSLMHLHLRLALSTCHFCHKMPCRLRSMASTFSHIPALHSKETHPSPSALWWARPAPAPMASWRASPKQR